MFLYNLNSIILSKKNIIKKISKKINNKIKDLFSTDHFLYLSMNDDFCVHKFKKGKNEGKFCGKKIRTNLNGKKNDYLCCSHSKEHIPTKRKKIEKKSESIIQQVDNPIIKKKKKRKPIKITIGNPFFLCFNNILL